MAAECGAVVNGNVDKWVEISKECKVGVSVHCEVYCHNLCTAVQCALYSTLCTELYCTLLFALLCSVST